MCSETKGLSGRVHVLLFQLSNLCTSLTAVSLINASFFLFLYCSAESDPISGGGNGGGRAQQQRVLGQRSPRFGTYAFLKGLRDSLCGICAKKKKKAKKSKKKVCARIHARAHFIFSRDNFVGKTVWVLLLI